VYDSELHGVCVGVSRSDMERDVKYHRCTGANGVPLGITNFWRYTDLAGRLDFFGSFAVFCV